MIGELLAIQFLLPYALAVSMYLDIAEFHRVS